MPWWGGVWHERLQKEAVGLVTGTWVCSVEGQAEDMFGNQGPIDGAGSCRRSSGKQFGEKREASPGQVLRSSGVNSQATRESLRRRSRTDPERRGKARKAFPPRKEGKSPA